MFKSRGRASKLLRQLQLKQPDEPEPPKQDYLSERDCHRTYSCIHCRAHLANHDELISKLFQGNHGRAYLFNKVVNVGCKQAVERELLTGLHAVADIYCDCCETTLGWKYEQAFVPSQKYKEGKYIIELVHMLKENNWDLTSYNSKQLLEQQLVEEKEEEKEAEEGVNSKELFTNDREISKLNGRQSTTAPLSVHKQPGAIRKPISTSSSYTTISLRIPEQSKNHNLNSSGGSSSVTSSSSSSSHENLGQLDETGHRRDASARCVVDRNEKTLTTRQSIQIDHSQQDSADDNTAAISMQQ